MAWTVTALLSAASYSLLNVLDKRLLTRHMPSVASYYLWVGFSLVLVALVALLVFGLPPNLGTGLSLAAYGSGLSWGFGVAFVFLALRLEEASRAVAIYHVFPVFVALLAVAFLDESLNLGQWLAIAVVVAGAFLISLQSMPSRAVLSLNKSLPILILASFMFGLSHFASKAALEDLPVTAVWVFRNLGVATILLLFARPSVVIQALRAVKSRSTAALLLPAMFVVAPTSVVLMLVATSLGPVSLVATLIGTRPFFVFLYCSILSTPRIRFLDEPLRKETLALKFVSIVLIIGGASALRLL